jgi:hypothetical protein
LKFKTADIVSRIDALLAASDTKAIEREGEQENKALTARYDWLSEHEAGFAKFAANIVKAIRNKVPVTIEDVPDSIRRHGDLKFYFGPSKGRPLAEERQAENLRKLRNALCASTEETVSPTAIKQLGFQDVTFLFTEGATK